jgi:uncharacterized surface protein with fasciclin (FAS1) repeats
MRLHSLRAAPAACAALAVGLAVALAACGRTTTTSATPTGSAGPVNVTPSPSLPTAGTTARVGADCAMIPVKGKGSIGSMSTQQALNAAASNPQLSVFIAAVRRAGLDRALNTRHSYTLIVPANSAFASLSKTEITQLRSSGFLGKTVRYHTLKSKIAPQEFVTGARPLTLQGTPLSLSKSGSVYKVNGATVLCGNIKTRNATVYIVNKVLLPPR